MEEVLLKVIHRLYCKNIKLKKENSKFKKRISELKKIVSEKFDNKYYCNKYCNFLQENIKNKDDRIYYLEQEEKTYIKSLYADLREKENKIQELEKILKDFKRC